MSRGKTSTDAFWDSRPLSVDDPSQVNIDDLAQRQLENTFIFRQLDSSYDVLEVGCGNGFLTSELREKVNHVTSFDFSDSMIRQAKEIYGEVNNKFYVQSVLEKIEGNRQYDCAICLRVLINLQDTNEQILALENIYQAIKAGGKLILIEGYSDGFNRLNELRKQIGLEKLAPAPINYYSRFAEIEDYILSRFTIIDTGHSGLYDFLTRIIYPSLVGADKATGYSDFHAKTLKIAQSSEQVCFDHLARLRFLCLAKK